VEGITTWTEEAGRNVGSAGRAVGDSGNAVASAIDDTVSGTGDILGDPGAALRGENPGGILGFSYNSGRVVGEAINDVTGALENLQVTKDYNRDRDRDRDRDDRDRDDRNADRSRSDESRGRDDNDPSGTIGREADGTSYLSNPAAGRGSSGGSSAAKKVEDFGANLNNLSAGVF
jgi:hypothetical protein